MTALPFGGAVFLWLRDNEIKNYFYLCIVAACDRHIFLESVFLILNGELRQLIIGRDANAHFGMLYVQQHIPPRCESLYLP